MSIVSFNFKGCFDGCTLGLCGRKNKDDDGDEGEDVRSVRSRDSRDSRYDGHRQNNHELIIDMKNDAMVQLEDISSTAMDNAAYFLVGKTDVVRSCGGNEAMMDQMLINSDGKTVATVFPPTLVPIISALNKHARDSGRSRQLTFVVKNSGITCVINAHPFPETDKAIGVVIIISQKNMQLDYVLSFIR